VQVRQWLTGGGDPPKDVHWVLPAKRMAVMPVRVSGGEFKHGWSSRLMAGSLTGTATDAPHMAEMLEAALAGLRAEVGEELCGLPVMVVPDSASGPVGEQGVASGSAKKRSVGRRRTVINKVGREREVGAVHSVRERIACVAVWYHQLLADVEPQVDAEGEEGGQWGGGVRVLRWFATRALSCSAAGGAFLCSAAGGNTLARYFAPSQTVAYRRPQALRKQGRTVALQVEAEVQPRKAAPKAPAVAPGSAGE
jgi:hypothetical protein